MGLKKSYKKFMRKLKKIPKYEVILVRKWGGYVRDCNTKNQAKRIIQAWRKQGLKGKAIIRRRKL